MWPLSCLALKRSKTCVRIRFPPSQLCYQRLGAGIPQVTWVPWQAGGSGAEVHGLHSAERMSCGSVPLHAPARLSAPDPPVLPLRGGLAAGLQRWAWGRPCSEGTGLFARFWASAERGVQVPVPSTLSLFLMVQLLKKSPPEVPTDPSATPRGPAHLQYLLCALMPSTQATVVGRKRRQRVSPDRTSHPHCPGK